MSLPERWQELIDLVLIPIAWVPRLQEALLAYFLAPASFWATAAKYVFLLFPALLGVAAVWVTLLSLYTLPFRRYRLRFVSMMLLAWWDAARAVTLYWGGVVRVAAVAVGWVLTLAALGVRLLVDALHRLATTPVGLAGRAPHGVPWIACAVVLAWCVLEAAVFTYTTMPTVSRALTGVSGGGEESRLATGVLYGFLLLLIMGSFACLQILADAVRAGQARVIAQMAVVQGLVMLFEVLFLFRPLVDALVPLVAGQPGARLGPWSAMALASLAWGATRTLTWFLFAQHGTAPLLAFLARRADADASSTRTAMAPQTWWRPAAGDFEREVEWLHVKGEQLTGYVALPVLQLVAAALNFALLVVASRPVFHLPFRAMREVTDTRDLLATLHLIPRKQPSL